MVSLLNPPSSASAKLFRRLIIALLLSLLAHAVLLYFFYPYIEPAKLVAAKPQNHGFLRAYLSTRNVGKSTAAEIIVPPTQVTSQPANSPPTLPAQASVMPAQVPALSPSPYYALSELTRAPELLTPDEETTLPNTLVVGPPMRFLLRINTVGSVDTVKIEATDMQMAQAEEIATKLKTWVFVPAEISTRKVPAEMWIELGGTAPLDLLREKKGKNPADLPTAPAN